MNPVLRIRLALFNLILLSIIFLDSFVPGDISSIERLNYIYTIEVKTSGGQKSTYDSRIILELKNGERYRIARSPDADYENGQNIQIVKSLLLKQINQIVIIKDSPTIVRVNLASTPVLFSLLVLSILISIASFFTSSKMLRFGLIAATMFTTIFAFVLVFYF